MDFAEYRSHDAVGLAELVAAKQVTPDELLAAARERAAAVNPRINAIVRDIDPPPATTTPPAPFHGVPFLIKDLAQEYAGQPSGSGSRALQHHRAAEHSTVVRKWLDAGLVIFGQTTCPEFGAKGITEPDVTGPTRNPWDLDRTPGGSSGGSAAAVAAGIVPCAGTNDGGGSTRIPAACCGLVGLKPSRGLTSLGPLAGDMMHGAAVQGVASRTVRDTAAMFDVIAGGDDAAPYAAAIPPDSFASEVGRDPGKLRIGVCLPTVVTPQPDPEARAAVDVAVTALTDLGHEVEILDAPPYDDAEMSKAFLLAWFVFIAWEVEQAMRRTGCGEDAFERDTRVMAALGRSTSSVRYVDAVMRRHDHTRRLAEFFGGHDLLLTPTLARLPLRIGELDLPKPLATAADLLLRTKTARVLSRTKLVDEMVEKNLGWIPYTQLANITGRPAITVPVHHAAGMPMGVQFVAPLGGEGTLLRVAAQLEEAVPWSGRRAPV